jgi:hypothetical protein
MDGVCGGPDPVEAPLEEGAGVRTPAARRTKRPGVARLNRLATNTGQRS